MFLNLFLAVVFLGYLVLLGLILGRRFFPPDGSRALPRTATAFDHPSEPFLELRDVDKSFDYPVLKGVSFKMRQGETLGVLGKSGSGKSVTLKLIAGLLKPDVGHILFNGKDITEMTERELLELRKRVSYVFQGGAIFDFLDVGENVAYPMRERGMKDEEKIKERVHDLLASVEMENMGGLQKPELSIGAKKQVAIARAIANDPKMILYDEPTTGVDPLVKKSVNRLIRKLNEQENLTSVVVTHDLKCIEMVADRIMLLKDGVIHFDGDHEAFYSSPDPYIQAFIAGKRFDEERRQDKEVEIPESEDRRQQTEDRRQEKRE